MTCNRSPALVAALLALLMAGCRATRPGPAPFPDLGAGLDRTQVLATLARRTRGVRLLYGELGIDYTSPKLSGTFEAVCHYEAPHRMRFAAFKDLFVSTRHIFDLLLLEQEYAFRFAPPKKDVVVDRGPLARYPQKHPRFGAFFWAREALFLPGVLARDGDAELIDVDADTLELAARLPSGAAVRYTLQRRTLRVMKAVVTTDGEVVYELSYDDYRRLGELYVPGKVVLVDAAQKIRVVATLQAIEADPEAPDASVFDPDEVVR